MKRAMERGGEMGTGRGDARKRKMECRLCGWWQRCQKKSLLSTGLPLIILPLSCVSLLTAGPQIAMLCNLALISADNQTEGRSSEAGRGVKGCSEWLAGHLTVGYLRDNNVWRQAGVMYVLQKNNCYPFKSHFLIGLAVVKGELGEETSVRKTGGKRTRRS